MNPIVSHDPAGVSTILFNPTPRDRELIRGIQIRVGLAPTGDLDTATLTAIAETLDTAQEFFARLLGTKWNNFTAAPHPDSRRDPAVVRGSTE